MSSLLIYGAGGHGRKVYFGALSVGWTVEAFVDDSAVGAPVPDVPVLAWRDVSLRSRSRTIFVAIGRPGVRRELTQRLSNAGWTIPSIIHSRAWISPDARLEPGVLVAAGAVVETGCQIGEGAIIDVGAVVDHDSVIEPYAHVRAGVAVPAYSRYPVDAE